jgi:hypothetical protein
MTAAANVESFAEVLLGLFPWLARFGLDPGTKRLQVHSAGDGLDLEGGGQPVIRATPQSGSGDTGGQLAHNSMDGLVYYLAPGGAAYVPVAVYSVAPGPPPPSFPGTVVVLGPGSGKVTSG